jgi:hypothetical protein
MHHQVERTNLECQISLLHPEVGTDVLVDTPSKLVVQLPANHSHQNRRQGDHAGYRNQKWSDLWPDIFFSERLLGYRGRIRQSGIRILDLVHLNGGIYQHGQIEYADTNDLDGVLQPECVIAETDEENVREDEQRQIAIAQQSA